MGRICHCFELPRLKLNISWEIWIGFRCWIPDNKNYPYFFGPKLHRSESRKHNGKKNIVLEKHQFFFHWKTFFDRWNTWLLLCEHVLVGCTCVKKRPFVLKTWQVSKHDICVWKINASIDKHVVIAEKIETCGVRQGIFPVKTMLRYK